MGGRAAARGPHAEEIAIKQVHVQPNMTILIYIFLFDVELLIIYNVINAFP